ncbi:hypothetical protein BDV10DRAFT_98881 [Aspergillus recurvatus]
MDGKCASCFQPGLLGLPLLGRVHGCFSRRNAGLSGLALDLDRDPRPGWPEGCPGSSTSSRFTLSDSRDANRESRPANGKARSGPFCRCQWVVAAMTALSFSLSSSSKVGPVTSDYFSLAESI